MLRADFQKVFIINQSKLQIFRVWVCENKKWKNLHPSVRYRNFIVEWLTKYKFLVDGENYQGKSKIAFNRKIRNLRCKFELIDNWKLFQISSKYCHIGFKNINDKFAKIIRKGNPKSCHNKPKLSRKSARSTTGGRPLRKKIHVKKRGWFRRLQLCYSETYQKSIYRFFFDVSS